MLFFFYFSFINNVMTTTKCDDKYNELLSEGRDMVVIIQNTMYLFIL